MTSITDAQCTLQPLDIELDLNCPISWPINPLPNAKVPSSRSTVERLSTTSEPLQGTKDIHVSSFVQNRYFETLYLPEALSPLTFFAADLLRINTQSKNAAAPTEDVAADKANVGRKSTKSNNTSRMEPLADCMLDLASIERKHRKVLPSVLQKILLDEDISAAAENDSSTMGSDSTLSAGATIAVAGPTTLLPGETQALASGIDHRKMAARSDLLVGADASGAEDLARPIKRLTDEFERREVQLQVLLLLTHMLHVSPSKSSKRKRDREKTASTSSIRTTSSHPADDPRKALDMLTDRLTVWQVVGGLHDDSARMGSSSNEDDGEDWVTRFCHDVVEEQFISLLPELCADIHLKVFQPA